MRHQQNHKTNRKPLTLLFPLYFAWNPHTCMWVDWSKSEKNEPAVCEKHIKKFQRDKNTQKRNFPFLYIFKSTSIICVKGNQYLEA